MNFILFEIINVTQTNVEICRHIQTIRQIDIQTDRQIGTYIQTNRDTLYIQVDTQAGRHLHTLRHKLINIQTLKHINILTYTDALAHCVHRGVEISPWTHPNTHYTQTDRHLDTQTYVQTDPWIHRLIDTNRRIDKQAKR